MDPSLSATGSNAKPRAKRPLHSLHHTWPEVGPEVGPEIWPQSRTETAEESEQLQSFRLDHAVNALRRAHPEYSAASPYRLWQRLVGIAVVFCAPFWLMLKADAAALVVHSVMALPFFLMVLVRLLAIWELYRRPDASYEAGPSAIADDDLPTYSVLIALYRETEVATVLVRAMAALEYPRDKLEIVFVTEACDADTRAALSSAGMTSNMHIVIVPPGKPQTKPRALNYALSFVSGELLAVYDAEDIPESNQLRRAAFAFQKGGEDLVCVQAHLNIYNSDTNAITRQFTLEYSALFDCILPALARLGLPLPLGGTSNHFRRAALERAGAWDPYNVTEDADLGIRLARHRRRIEILPSTTWEEAPSNARAWLNQRTRWLKGWMQTYLVHMRSPLRLWRDLGPWRFLGFQVLMGGMILASFVHPLFYIGLALGAAKGNLLVPPDGHAAALLWRICWFNLAACYATAIVLDAVAARRRGHGKFARSALLLPLYWLAISFAAYRALIDLIRRPHYWAKTPHSGLPMPNRSARPVAGNL